MSDSQRRAGHTKKSSGYLHEGTAVRYHWIKDNRSQFHASTLCRVLKVSTSGFYAWLIDPVGKRGREDEKLSEQIKEVFKGSLNTYGSRRMCRALRKKHIRCTRRRMCRLMQKLGLCPKRQRRFRRTTDSKHGFDVHPNLLAREFCVLERDRVWVSDLTYIWTDEGWLYLSTVIELYSRRVVGWSMSDSLKSKVAIDALEMPTFICDTYRVLSQRSKDDESGCAIKLRINSDHVSERYDACHEAE